MNTIICEVNILLLPSYGSASALMGNVVKEGVFCRMDCSKQKCLHMEMSHALMLNSMSTYVRTLQWPSWFVWGQAYRGKWRKLFSNFSVTYNYFHYRLMVIRVIIAWWNNIAVCYQNVGKHLSILEVPPNSLIMSDLPSYSGLSKPLYTYWGVY